MISNDSFKDNQTEKVPVDDYFDGIEHSSFQKRKTGFNLLKMMGTPLFVIGAGILVLVLLAGIMLNKAGDTMNIGEQEGTEIRIKKLEDRLADMETFEQKLAELENQLKKLDLLQNHMDRIETNLASQLNQFSSKFESAMDKSAKERKTPLKAPVDNKQKIGSKTVGKYHQVRSGETLYGIGRDYNVSTEELYRLNPSLSRKSGIYPGQKIRISEN
ncbi:MAG: LysM domain-containing protein [Desulfobacterales bacterium]